MFGILLQQAQHLMDICATEDDEDEADETKASELETIAPWQGNGNGQAPWLTLKLHHFSPGKKDFQQIHQVPGVFVPGVSEFHHVKKSQLGRDFRFKIPWIFDGFSSGTGLGKAFTYCWAGGIMTWPSWATKV